MIGLIHDEPSFDNKFYFTDKFGRNISISSNEFTIIKLSDYLNEDYLFDISENKKISYDEFYNKICGKDSIKLISKLNNKIIVQKDETISLYSLKNEDDANRILEIITNEKIKPYIISYDISIEQRKYLYSLLEEHGYDKQMLYRKFTTHPRE